MIFSVVSTAWRRGGCLALVAIAVASPSEGQLVRIKSDLPAAMPPLCPPVAPVDVVPSQEDRDTADRLASQARQLTIVGDQTGAIELLRQAEQLNPASSDVAYLLGRAEQEQGMGEEAARHYCRYLAVAPGAEDGDEVRTLVTQLLPPPEPLFDEAGGERFRDGVDAWTTGDVARAYAAFSDVVLMAPRLAEGHYNRGLVAAYQNRSAQAVADLNQYIALQPAAEDRPLVEEWVSHLANPVQYRNPTMALAGGLAVPGLGQFMTGSSVGGISLLAIGGGAAAFGLGYKTVNIRCLSLPENGTCPDGQVHSSDEEREYLVPGLAAYGGLALIGAVLAFRKAGQNNRMATEAARFRPVPGGSGGASFEGPAPFASRGRVGVRWIRFAF